MRHFQSSAAFTAAIYGDAILSLRHTLKFSRLALVAAEQVAHGICMLQSRGIQAPRVAVIGPNMTIRTASSSGSLTR